MMYRGGPHFQAHGRERGVLSRLGFCTVTCANDLDLFFLIKVVLVDDDGIDRVPVSTGSLNESIWLCVVATQGRGSEE